VCSKPGQQISYAFSSTDDFDSANSFGLSLEPGQAGELAVDYREALYSIRESINNVETAEPPTRNAPYPIQLDTYLLATDASGTYLVDRETNNFGWDIVLTSQRSEDAKYVSSATGEALVRFIAPPIQIDYRMEGEICVLELECYNPFPESLLITVKQPMPSDVTVLDVGDAQILDGSLEWQCGLCSGDRWSREMRLQVPSVYESGYLFPRATYSFYYTGDGTTKVYESNDLALASIPSSDTPTPTGTPTDTPAVTNTPTATPTGIAPEPTATETPNSDLNGDGRVDDEDLLLLMRQWHKKEAQ
jgi:hypothetical protein